MALTTTLFYKKFAEAHRLHGLQVYAKDQKWTWLWRMIDALLNTFTGGKMNTFFTGYVTTVGHRVFFPAGWNSGAASRNDYIVLCHEIKHVEQFGKYGVVLMALLYLLFPLPVGLAYFRYRFEREAYVAGYRAAAGVGVGLNVDDFIAQLSGPAYFWAWPFKKNMKAWFARQGVL